jgi:hypothetical protein
VRKTWTGRSAAPRRVTTQLNNSPAHWPNSPRSLPSLERPVDAMKTQAASQAPRATCAKASMPPASTRRPKAAGSTN